MAMKSKRGAVRKPASKKAASKKAPSKKAANKKAPSKKAPSKKAPSKKAPSKKAPNKKAPSKKAPSKKAPSKKAPSKAAPVVATAGDWRPALRAAVEATGPDFAAFLAGHGTSATAWEHADAPELVGLERWATELAKQDPRAAIGALVRTAQYGLPIIFERGGVGLDGMGFKASEPSHDGAPVERQIELAAAWLDAPDRAHLDAVRAGNDPSRQLYIWSEDLRPNDDRAHWWYSDVGQCCGHAITNTKGSATAEGYYEWTPEVCVARGLVLAVRGLRERGTHMRDILASVRDALVA